MDSNVQFGRKEICFEHSSSPMLVPKTMAYTAKRPYTLIHGTVMVAAPPMMRAKLLQRRGSTQGLSEKYPTITLPTVLAMPIMEMRKAAIAFSICIP